MRFTSTSTAILSLLTVTGLAVAQDQPGGSGPDQQQQAPYPYPYPSAQNQQRYPAPQDYPPQVPVPSHLTVKPGTYVTVRINQWLSSDRNQAGDAFAASLEQPIVVDGVVVAQRGQTVGGRVSEAQKAGRVQGTSRLGLEVIDLTLVDGQVVPIRSSVLTRNGSTSVGRDVGAAAGTTALGAAAGAIADGGRGAAIGAGAGAAVGLAGILLTRGNPTVIYPESVMTFRVDAPLEIATDHAPQAFRYAENEDYGRGGPGPQPRMAGGPYGPPPPVMRPYPYGVAPYPYGVAPYPYGYPYYGSGFGVYVGPGFYYRGGGRYWRR